MANNLPSSWRALLGQQAVTTGRGITPAQAEALRKGELEAAYNISGQAEDRALRRRQVEDSLAMQGMGLEMQQNQFEEQLANRANEFTISQDLAKKQFEEQQTQNREQNRLNQSNIDKSSSAATTSGYIQAATALPMAYLAYQRYNDNKVPKVTATPQAIAPVDNTTNTNYEFFNQGQQPSYYDYGGYNYPSYDYGSYNYGGYDYPAAADLGTNTDYSFFNDTNYDWGGLWDFLGW
jgi:hypothetical protein